MPVIKKQDLRRTFTAKCGASERPGGNHYRYVFRIGGDVYARTLVSHGRGDLGEPIVGQIASQIGLNSRQLADLVSCSLDRANFEAILIARGYPPRT